MARNMMGRTAGTGDDCGSHETIYDAGSARRSFMKLATATATLTGLAMTVKMTAKAIEVDDKNQLCRSSDRIGVICTSCTVDCAIPAEV
jgi:anaerobic selenocysteine-containing dehydrogenase